MDRVYIPLVFALVGSGSDPAGYEGAPSSWLLAHLHTVLHEEGGHAGVVLINCISSVNILFLRTVKTVALHEGAPKENTESEYRVRTVKRVILF